jgi:hypothetical protein
MMNEELLRQYIGMILEADRGGIGAQQIIAKKLKKIAPTFDFASNKKGQQTTDVTITQNGEVVAGIESKSTSAAGLTTVFDKTITVSSSSVFDEFAALLITLQDKKINKKEPILSQFFKAVGGEVGQSKPVPKQLMKNMKDPAYAGMSHKLLSKDGKEKVFRAEPGDEARKKDGELIIFRLDRTGGIRAYNTVEKSGNKLITRSSDRPWSTSGSVPTSGGLSNDKQVLKMALKLMVDHFRYSGDNYFILVEGDTIYPFVVPRSPDPLGLKDIGAPTLSLASFTRAGLSTSGNAGAGKVRMGLKVKFNKTFSL